MQIRIKDVSERYALTIIDLLLLRILSPRHHGSPLDLEHTILSIISHSPHIRQEVIVAREQPLSLSDLNLGQQVVLIVGLLLHLELALVAPHRTWAEGTREGGLDLSLLLRLLLDLLGLEGGY